MKKSENIVWSDSLVNQELRQKQMQQKGVVLWLTGLSGSGKSTIAKNLEKKLFEKGYLPFVLDGDNVRHGLNADLGFSEKDRQENIRRVANVANLFIQANLITITAFISPFRDDRQKARKIIGDSFIEIFCKASLQTCEKRDPKGLYKKARAGEIKNFTGIDQTYEEPQKAELVLDTENLNIDEATQKIFDYLQNQKILLKE